MFYILQYSYNPNTAACNRLFGFYKTLDQLGIETTIVFLAPNNAYSKIGEKYKYLHFEYLYNTIIPYKKFLKKWLVSSAIQQFVKRLRAGDVVYTYQISKLTLACQNIPGVKVFAEMTEHPDACMCVADPSILLNKENFKKCVKSLSGLFVISRPLKEFFVGLGIDSSRVEIINMTVDPFRFINIRKQSGKERYIAYCGTASNTKDGVDDLIKAFAIVVREVPDVYLYIVGKTPHKSERYGNFQLVKKLGIDEKVRFTGEIPASDMPQMLKNAEILALDRPANIQATYGFPTKLGEYLLTGNVVVVTSVGDIPLFLKDGISALIAKPSDSKDFAMKILWALKHKDKARSIGVEGYKVAKYHFNSKIECEKMICHMKLCDNINN